MKIRHLPGCPLETRVHFYAKILSLLGAFFCAAATPSAGAAVLVAEYDFNDTFAPSFGSAPTLVPIDPQSQNAFETALVNGSSKRVFHWTGDGSNPALNAGFSLNTVGLVAPNNYSVEMVFEFLEPAAFGGGWRRILDTQNRLSDRGFYVAPNNVLQVYNVVSGSTVFTTPGFHTVLLTNFVVEGKQEVKVYLDGVLELTSNTDQLNLDSTGNPDHLLHFFVDNVAGPAQQEFAEGRIATLRIYDGVVVPEPTSNATVSVSNTDGLQAIEGGAKCIVTLRRNGDLSAALTVAYKVGGTAIGGVHYKTLPGSATFQAGSANAKIKIKAIQDEEPRGNTKVKVTLLPSAGYTLGESFKAKVKVIDND